ncbi:hypothetical protein V8G54_031467 [Vigna mungo]|uniref:AP2/ERF domain-containing protein n=1 Tax=Vigna mungo TaxID=3915 RepID=A0AAQ3MJG0_VIGMU
MSAIGYDVGRKKHYRGVCQRPWGKFATEIRDSNKRGSRVWLGTFDTAIEAAKAYDRAVFRLCDSKVILNFPFEAGTADATAKVEDERKLLTNGYRFKKLVQLYIREVMRLLGVSSNSSSDKGFQFVPQFLIITIDKLGNQLKF